MALYRVQIVIFSLVLYDVFIKPNLICFFHCFGSVIVSSMITPKVHGHLVGKFAAGCDFQCAFGGIKW